MKETKQQKVCDLKAGNSVLGTCRTWFSFLEKGICLSAFSRTPRVHYILGKVHLGFHDGSCSICVPLLLWSFSLA
jgi:hypothetical protein